MEKAAKEYTVQFSSAMVGYVLVLFASTYIIKADPDAWWRVPLAVAPVVPAFFALLSFIRYLGRMDELQRQIQLEAIAFGAGATAILSFGYGFLENVGFPDISLIFVLPLLVALWGLGACIASRKYS